MRNTGKPSEKIFDAFWGLKGKIAHVYQFVDASKLFGLNKNKLVNAPAQPSDRLVTYIGHTFYAEVKSTEDPKVFKLSLLRKKQSAAAKQIIAAGGDYRVYIHSLALRRWFCVPYQILDQLKKQSLSWDELEAFRWKDIDAYLH